LSGGLKESSYLRAAPNAKFVVQMMADSGASESRDKYKKLVPEFIGMSPLDPRLPKMLEDW
jgi:hypothetical protein